MQNDKPSERCATETCSRAEEYVIEKAAQAVASAAGVGMLVSLLPVGRMVGLLVDVAFSLVRPILMGVGIYKIFQYCGENCAADVKTKSKQPKQ